MSYRTNALSHEKPLRWYQLVWRRLFGPAVKPPSPTEPEPEREFNAEWAKEVADKYVANIPTNPHLQRALEHFKELVRCEAAMGHYYVAFEPFGVNETSWSKGIGEDLRSRLRSAFQDEVGRLGFRCECAWPKDRIWWGPKGLFHAAPPKR